MQAVRNLLVAGVSSLLLAACLSGSPQPECDPGPGGAGTIPCYLAVQVASAQLPPGHPRIGRVQFLYGSLHPTTGFFSGTLAYVVFTYADGSRVGVQLIEWHGRLAAKRG